MVKEVNQVATDTANQVPRYKPSFCEQIKRLLLIATARTTYEVPSVNAW